MNTWTIGALAVVGFIGALAFTGNLSSVNQLAASIKGFDQYGYNHTARIFNGTGSSWCLAGGQSAECMGDYSADKLLMKWTSGWDRGNAENWAHPPYDDAWINNEWNGKGVSSGSGAVWHYKIKWVGECEENLGVLPTGSYCVWGQFAALMDQGVDPSYGPGHLWFAHAKPNGYGSSN